MAIKKRSFLTNIETWNGLSVYNNGILFSAGSSNQVLFGRGELLASEGHLLYRPRKKSSYKGKHPRKVLPQVGQFDSGGPCTISKVWLEAKAQKVTIRPSSSVGLGFGMKEGGNVLFLVTAGVPTAPSSIPAELSDLQLTAYGVKAWAAAKPTASQGGLGQAIGELHDLPKIPEIKSLRDALSKTKVPNSKRKLAYGIGSNYLNIVFGWLPLVSDVKDLVKNIRNFNKNLTQLERDNAQGVRRSRKIRGGETTSTVVQTGTGPYNGPGQLQPSMNAANVQGSWTYTQTVTTKWDYRFSARFRYYIDFAKAYQGSYTEAARLSRILFGADLSAYTLYQLMPWSWAIDWITNIGVNLNNARDQEDHLVADYAYINGKYTKDTVYTLEISFAGDTVPVREFRFSVRETHFRRIKASPFGFGLTFGGFNPKQLAILGALGLTKLS